MLCEGPPTLPCLKLVLFSACVALRCGSHHRKFHFPLHGHMIESRKAESQHSIIKNFYCVLWMIGSHKGLYPRERPGQIFILAKPFHSSVEVGYDEDSELSSKVMMWHMWEIMRLWAKANVAEMERRGRIWETGDKISSPQWLTGWGEGEMEQFLPPTYHSS